MAKCLYIQTYFCLAFNFVLHIYSSKILFSEYLFHCFVLDYLCIIDFEIFFDFFFIELINQLHRFGFFEESCWREKDVKKWRLRDEVIHIGEGIVRHMVKEDVYSLYFGCYNFTQERSKNRKTYRDILFFFFFTVSLVSNGVHLDDFQILVIFLFYKGSDALLISLFLVSIFFYLYSIVCCLCRIH